MLITSVASFYLLGLFISPSVQQALEYGYEDFDGPTDWDRIAPICGIGRGQSPIDINSTLAIATSIDEVGLEDVAAPGVNFTNNGHTVQVNLGGPISVLNGQNYVLRQFHFHTPSEHRLRAEHYEMEIHFVHGLETNLTKLAVIGLFIEVTDKACEADPLLTSLAKRLRYIPKEGNTTLSGPLDFSGIRQHLDYARVQTYSGSLTTPPCAEGTTWFVSDFPIKIAVKDYLTFRHLLKYNARYLQGLLNSENVLQYACEGLNLTSG